MTQPTPSPLMFTEQLDFTGLRIRNRDETLGAIVHCSASKPTQLWDAVEIDRMHRRRGFLCIGYHFVIGRNGVIYIGRPVDTRGAHCKNGSRNYTHVGVCLVGGVSQRPQEHVPGNPWNGSDAEANFTPEQATSLVKLLDHLKGRYGFGDEAIEGHRDVPGVRKACPSMDTQHFLQTGKFILG